MQEVIKIGRRFNFWFTSQCGENSYNNLLAFAACEVWNTAKVNEHSLIKMLPNNEIVLSKSHAIH